MTLLSAKLREISVFIYTLILLLIFNLYFNLNYTWYGISLIVRVYIFVFAFYLVFIFASLDINQHIYEYSNRFGNKGKVILFIETRAIPFLLIYLITIIFTLIDYISQPNWPWNPITSLLNGRYSNNIIYSWILLIILKLKKKPNITIPLWICIAIIYGMLDKIFYSTFESGIIIFVFKILKMTVFLFFLFSEFYNISKGMILSIVLSLFIYSSIIASYSIVFNYTKSTSFESKEAGLILLRMGFTYPQEKLKKAVIKTCDYDLIRRLLPLLKQNDNKINYSQEEWEYLLFSGSVNMADLISKYIINKNFDISYEKIILYADQKSRDETSNLDKATNFIKLSSRYCRNNEKDFLERLKKSNRIFKIWGIRVLTENKSIESIPLLLNFLTDIDETVAHYSYEALKIITGIDPTAALDKKINDPDIIAIFKKYYLKYSQNHKAP